MERGVWKKAVVLEMYGRPGVLTVSDTLDAALMLLGAWPAKRGDAHMVAVMTCRDVLTGKATPGMARGDFIDAAFEAGFHVGPETFLNENWVPEPMPNHHSPADKIMSGNMGSRLGATRTTSKQPAVSKTPSVEPPAIRWDSPPAFFRTSGGQPMRQLLRKLGEVLGMIMLEVVRNAAGMMNVDVRRRSS